MNIKYELVIDNIYAITITGVDIDNNSNVDRLKSIIRILTNGNKFYFQFRREEDILLEINELIKYRFEIPKYFNDKGKYKVYFRLDEKRFDSIGFLPIVADIYEQIMIFWKYFYSILFFNPKSNFGWQEFERLVENENQQVYGLHILKKRYADSAFIKGHDGNSLTFVYRDEYDKKLFEKIKMLIEED